ncbi:unnamed protein product, partial [Ectocarpus fasciculatus]
MDELARWRAAARRRVADTADGKDSTGDNDGPAPAVQGGGEGGGGGSANVMVLAATNAPEAVDAAFLRPGRFDEIVYAGLPDADGRQQILGASKARMEGLSTTAAAATGASTATAAVLTKDERGKASPVHPDGSSSTGGSGSRPAGGGGRGGRWA